MLVKLIVDASPHGRAGDELDVPGPIGSRLAAAGVAVVLCFDPTPQDAAKCKLVDRDAVPSAEATKHLAKVLTQARQKKRNREQDAERVDD